MNHSRSRTRREITCTGREEGLPATSRRWRSPWRRPRSRTRSPWRSCGGRAGREGTWSRRPAHLPTGGGEQMQRCCELAEQVSKPSRANKLRNASRETFGKSDTRTQSESGARARGTAAKCLACKTEQHGSLRETTSAPSNTAHLGLFLESVNNRWLTRKRIPSVALSNGGLALFLKHKKENTTKKNTKTSADETDLSKTFQSK